MTSVRTVLSYEQVQRNNMMSSRPRQKLTHRIIAEVKKRPFIWKRADPLYRNRVASFKAWIEMGRKIGVKPETVKFRWRSLRDIFQKEMRRIQKHLKDGGEPSSLRFWTYFRNMLFLKDEYDDPVRYPEIHLEEEEVVETEQEEVNVKDEFVNCEDQYEVETLESVESWSEEMEDVLAQPEVRVTPGPSHNKVKLITIKESTQKPSEDDKPAQEESLDEDMLFLKSLAPYLKGIDTVRKLRLKSKIQNLIADELCNDDDD